MAFDKNIDGTITRSDSSTIHSIVICGYKKVINPENGKVLEVFKVQNSYGTDWQLQNNNGWIDAEKLLENTPAFWSERIKKIIYYSDVLVWLKY
jgi:C1A family cysteine protease